MKMCDNEKQVITLVAAETFELTQELIDAVYLQIGATHTTWLKPQRAADIFFQDNPKVAIKAIISALLKDNPIDVFIQPVAKRQKKLLLADMESTIIEQEMLNELADEVGLKEKVAEITSRAMNGELDFASAVKERVALLKKTKTSVLDKVAEKITFSPGALALVSAMHEQGAQCWLASGGFTYFAEKVAAQAGFDKVVANKLEIIKGEVTGEIDPPLFDKNGKKDLVDLAVTQLGLSVADIVSIGDGANDVPMLNACNAGGGLGIAYRGKPNVRANVYPQINHTDLRSVLYAQGVMI